MKENEWETRPKIEPRENIFGSTKSVWIKFGFVSGEKS